MSVQVVELETGLGLMKRIVGRYGREGWAAGRIGEGATFGFRRPDRMGDR